jgi:hypothetical protein
MNSRQITDMSDDELVQLIFQACAEVTRRTGRKASPDGHLVGTLGELHAAKVLGLTLAPQSTEGYDATDEIGNLVEIKTTTRAGFGLSATGTKATRLVALKLDGESGRCSVVWDGPADVAWARAGKPQKNGQRRLSLSALRKLAGQEGQGRTS